MDCADCHVSENLICHKDEYAEAKRRELNLIVCSSKFEAKVLVVSGMQLTIA